MTTTPSAYEICAGELEWERLNGEVIVISFKSGKYFSLSGAAADLWSLIVEVIPVSDWHQVLSQEWQGAEIDQREIDSFISECLAEGLIREALTPPLGEVKTKAGAIQLLKDFDRKVFAVSLMTFGNLQDLIMVDPVHDASLINWPLPTDASI